MIELERVSAVIVTRGDVDVTPSVDAILEAGIADVVVWDNSTREENMGVFGRYRAIRYALGDVVFVQDDDVVMEPDSILDLLGRWEPGHCVANMPARFREHYTDSYLVGFGAAFERGLPLLAWMRFADAHYADFREHPPARALTGAWLARFDETFARTCDVVFSTLTPGILVDVPYADREYATGPERMYRQPEHVGERARMLERARAAR